MMMSKIMLIGAAMMLFASFAASFSTFHSRAIATMRQSGINKSILYSSPEGGEPESAPKSKGFGAAKVKKEEVEEEKDEGTKTYESQAKRGVPEYNIFLRPKNGTEAEWVPVGSMVRCRYPDKGQWPTAW
jgi:Family of unknown function (DUF6523)